jgi:hemolysin activation/secretion protein
MNASQDIKVEPVIMPGKEVGTIDVELKVEDHLPLHGYLELNNRASHDTKELRLNAMIRYDNLWQKGHSIAFQYQTGPQEPKEVQVVGGSYVLPAPWHEDHQIALFAIWSDSDTAFGEGFNIVGSGKIFGARYVIPLPPYRLYSHNVTLGVDYKDFNESVGFTTESDETTETPITYLPLSFSYSASLPDEWGVTSFSGLLNLSFRGVGSDESEFELKRYKGRANYLYAVAGVQRTQKLPFGMSLFAKADVQVSDQPLIDNEQYNAGGMESVRGYKESEAAGDNAVHGVLEVSFPDPLEGLSIGRRIQIQMKPFLFYDVAQLTIQEPLPDQDRIIKLEGAGVGVRGLMMKNVEYEMDWAMALASTDRTRSSDQRVYFRIKAFL